MFVNVRVGVCVCVCDRVQKHLIALVKYCIIKFIAALAPGLKVPFSRLLQVLINGDIAAGDRNYNFHSFSFLSLPTFYSNEIAKIIPFFDA